MIYTDTLAPLQGAVPPVDYERFIAALLSMTDDGARARLIENKRSKMNADVKEKARPRLAQGARAKQGGAVLCI